MKTWSEFYPDVLPSVMGCPSPVMDHNLRRSAQAFFERCHVWTQWLDDTRTSGAQEYDIALENQSELVKLQRATLAGRPILVTTPDALPDDWQSYPQGIGDCVFTRDRRTFTLLPWTSTGQVLRIEATLKPSNAAAGIRDDFFDLYVEPIAIGAKARIKALVGTEFYDPAAAQVLHDDFTRRVNTIEIQKFRGFSSSRPRARIKTF